MFAIPQTDYALLIVISAEDPDLLAPVDSDTFADLNFQVAASLATLLGGLKSPNERDDDPHWGRFFQAGGSTTKQFSGEYGWILANYCRKLLYKWVISPQFALLPELRIWNLPFEMDEDDEGSPKPSPSFCQPVKCLNNHEQPRNTEKYWLNHWFVNGSVVCYRYRWLNLVHPQEPLLHCFFGVVRSPRSTMENWWIPEVEGKNMEHLRFSPSDRKAKFIIYSHRFPLFWHINFLQPLSSQADGIVEKLTEQRQDKWLRISCNI